MEQQYMYKIWQKVHKLKHSAVANARTLVTSWSVCIHPPMQNTNKYKNLSGSYKNENRLINIGFQEQALQQAMTSLAQAADTCSGSNQNTRS